MPKLTFHFTTSTGVQSSTRSIRQYLVVDTATAKITLATDDAGEAQIAADQEIAGMSLEVIDLRKDGSASKPRQPKATPAPEPEPEPVFVSLGGRANRRHRPDGAGTLCRPGDTATPAQGDGPTCVKCERIHAKRVPAAA